MAAKKLYIVRWRSTHFFDETVQPGIPANDRRERLTAGFLKRQDAEQLKHEIERGRRAPPAGANPFLAIRRWRAGWYDQGEHIGMAHFTSMPEGVFDDWVRDLGLTPPAAERIPSEQGQPVMLRDWDGWWEANAAQMTDQQRMKIWEALDKLDFFEIVETKLVD